jgi:D-tyrosyl-tRNA(Tyr) deacylase
MPPNIEADCIIMLSSHKSKVPGKMLTAHVPGNWAEAGLGGEPRTLNIAAGSRLRKIAIEMKKEADKINWPFSLEADHHGPTINIPIIFVEIGNGEDEWKDTVAAGAVANAVARCLGSVETSTSTIGFGGGHYQKKITGLVIEGNLTIGHMTPKYVIDKIDEEMFKQAIEKNIERVEKVVVLKDETNASQKEKVGWLAKLFGLGYEEV